MGRNPDWVFNGQSYFPCPPSSKFRQKKPKIRRMYWSLPEGTVWVSFRPADVTADQKSLIKPPQKSLWQKVRDYLHL